MVLMRKRMAWEGSRWLSPAVFVAVTLLYALTFFLDIFSSPIFIDDFQGNYAVATYYYFSYSDKLISNVGLCLVAFLGVANYAQDYEEGAVYMRIQRMGKGRYAGMRIAQTCISAFLAGSLSLLLFYALFGCLFHMQAFPDEKTLAGMSAPDMLLAGNRAGTMAFLAIRAGLRIVCMNLLVLAVSLVIPKRRMLVAVPLVLWYLMHYVMAEQEWIPDWLQPNLVFNLNVYISPEHLGLGRLSDWGMIGLIVGILTALAFIVWLLFCLRLRKNGIFGGDQSE